MFRKTETMKIFLYFPKETAVHLGEPLRDFHHCFFRCFHFTTDFYYCFRICSLLIAFVHFTSFRVFRHCLFKCFYFTTDFHYCFSGFSFHQLSLKWLIVVRFFVFVLLHRESYRFERDFFTLRRLLPYSPFTHLPQYRECYQCQRTFFTLRRFLPYISSRHLAQPAFINASLGAGSSSSKVVGPCIEIRNTDLAHLFVSIKQCSAKGISRYVLFKALRNTILNSSRLWIHYVIAICIVKCMSYPIGHRSS